MKIEDSGVTAEYKIGNMTDMIDFVRFTEGDNVIEVPIHMLNLVWHAWA